MPGKAMRSRWGCYAAATNGVLIYIDMTWLLTGRNDVHAALKRCPRIEG
jgi:hypothetical protein